MKKTPLFVSAAATFVDDGTGLGSVCRAQLGPTVFGLEWVVKSIVTTTTSDTSQFNRSSQLIVYQNNEADTSQLFGSYNADNDVASGDEYRLLTLEKLLFVWRYGNIGAIATAIVRGVVEDQRNY